MLFRLAVGYLQRKQNGRQQRGQGSASSGTTSAAVRVKADELMKKLGGTRSSSVSTPTQTKTKKKKKKGNGQTAKTPQNVGGKGTQGKRKDPGELH